MSISHAYSTNKYTTMTAVILAGGKSSRLPKKAFLKIAGITAIEHLVGNLASFFDEIIIIAQTKEPYRYLGLPVYNDIIPGKGPLGDIYTGLSVSSNNVIFIVACDMPFINLKLIEYMSSFTKAFDCVVPCLENGFETLHAFYSKKCQAKCNELINANKLKVADLYAYFKVRKITPDEIKLYDPQQLSFFNMNTPQEYKKAKKIACHNFAKT